MQSAHEACAVSSTMVELVVDTPERCVVHVHLQNRLDMAHAYVCNPSSSLSSSEQEEGELGCGGVVGLRLRRPAAAKTCMDGSPPP